MQRKQSNITLVLLAVAAFCLLSTTASADPLPGQVLKFLQLPLNSGAPTALSSSLVFPGGAQFPGHDEISTAYQDPLVATPFYRGTFMADDFSDKVSTPVVHVQWWGSYPNQPVPAQTLVQKFMIAWESDVPANTAGTNFSQPGGLLQAPEIVTFTNGPLLPGQFTEKMVSPPGVFEPVFQYNAELALPFNEQAGTVYWLKIVALDDNHANPTDPGALIWGWHDRDWSIPDPLAWVGAPITTPFGEHVQGNLPGGQPVYHFQDDSVSGQITWDLSLPPQQGLVQSGYQPQNYLDPNAALGPIDGPPGIGQFSKDLAFALYTTPEPSTVMLMAMGSVALVWTALRRRRNG